VAPERGCGHVAIVRDTKEPRRPPLMNIIINGGFFMSGICELNNPNNIFAQLLINELYTEAEQMVMNEWIAASPIST
jgi:hypothetical protein